MPTNDNETPLPLAAFAVLGAAVLFVVLLRWHPGGPRVGRAIDDLGQLLAAATAAAAAGWRYRRSSPLTRRPWLLRWPSTALHGAARWRGLLDGVLVAGSLFIVSWVTALGSVIRSPADSTFAYAVSLAYPISDLVLLTLAIIVASHGDQGRRSGLAMLTVGLLCLCVADSGFAYLTAIGKYATGSPVDVGWFGGFLLIAAAAYTSVAQPADAADQALIQESTTKALLPYVPAGIGLAVAVTGELAGRSQKVTLVAATLVMATLLVRQLLAVLDNRRLVRQLTAAQLELQHQAFHDPLTGLANRALFADRLRHSLQLHRRDLRPLSLLYCDAR